MTTWTKRADLPTETVEGSVVAYDLATDTVHCLADDTSRVFASCTGASAEEIAASLKMTTADVLAQLNGLDALKLVDSSEPLINRKSILLGAAATATVAAWSIAAPMAAAAASGAVDIAPGDDAADDHPPDVRGPADQRHPGDGDGDDAAADDGRPRDRERRQPQHREVLSDGWSSPDAVPFASGGRTASRLVRREWRPVRTGSTPVRGATPTPSGGASS